MATLELRHVTVRRSGVAILDDVCLDVADGELVAVLGASGAGKTFLLRAVAGLEPIAAGSVCVGGVDVTDLAPAGRGISMMFQSPALLPHLDVRRNIAFPLEVRHALAAEIAERVGAESRALHLEALLERSPQTLSAGEAQLVQLARALVRVPSLLLLDEPLARLDAAVSRRLRSELRVLQQGYGVTTLLATNDPAEALSMADRLVVLDAGRVVQVGTPVEVYERPSSLAAAGCTGALSTLTMTVSACADGGYWLEHPPLRWRAWQPSLDPYVGALVVAGFRPSWAVIAVDGEVEGTVVTASPGSGTVLVAVGPDTMEVSVGVGAGGPAPHRGAVRFTVSRLALFDPVTGAAVA